MKGTQRRTIRKEKNNSAGFTLIEMIVTVAIIAIFSGVVVTLITTGSSLFRGVSGNTKSQVKAQETLDEIEDMIIDANRSIYYAYGSGTDMGTQITSDIDDSNTASKTFITCNEYENGDGTSRYVFDVLDWVGSEGKLYYSQREYTKASSNTEEENENGTGDNSENQQTADTSGISAESMDNGVAVFASADNDSGNGVVSGGSSDKAKDSKELIARSVFAEGIENFTADVTKVESERIVRFRLTTEENGKKVKTLHTVNLRNRIQVMKPDDAFATASSTDVRINIVGAPDSIDAGKSKILGYNLTGNGSIDPTTLKWEIVDGTEKGYFPELDPTYGKLTINDNATGTVTVIVSAETSDGKQTVTSAPVTIKINNTKTVTGIYTDDKTDLLVAAGYSGLNLSSVISWRYTYNDGTKGKDVVPVVWTIGDNCSYASVSSEGQITVDEGAGTAAENGSFTVTATNSENNVSGQVKVNIARIDITDPENDDSIFNVGDDKKLEYVYKEGGNPVSIPEADAVVSTVSKPDNAEDYTTTGQFADGDIGKWEVKRTVNLAAKRNGYGLVEDTRKFEVKDAKHKADIIETAVGEYVFGGRDYACGEYNDYSIFKFQKNWIPEENESHTLTWYLDGKTSEDTGFVGGTGETYGKLIHIGTDEEGFILRGVYVRKDKNGNEIETIVAEKSIPVISNVRVDSDKLPRELKIGNTYTLGIKFDVGIAARNEDGTIQHEKTEKYTDNHDEGTEISWQGNINSNGNLIDGYRWNVTSLYQSENEKEICGNVIAIAGAFEGSGGHHPKEYIQEAKITVNIIKPVVNIDINGADIAYTNETINMWAQVTVDGVKKDNLDVKWKCDTINWKANSTSDNNSTVSIRFPYKGTYTVTADVIVEEMNFTETKTLTINEHVYEAVIKARKPGTTTEITSAKSEETVEFYLEATVDGVATDEYQVEWVSYCSNPEAERNKKTFKCTQNWNSSYPVSATVTFANDKKIYPNITFTIK